MWSYIFSLMFFAVFSEALLDRVFLKYKNRPLRPVNPTKIKPIIQILFFKYSFPPEKDTNCNSISLLIGSFPMIESMVNLIKSGPSIVKNVAIIIDITLSA